uniref:Uncharacterized protein n=1 Tax=Glossina palpalis gambiensis TaxID=67801 RepID=A0A1B0AME7_9MUSC
MSKNALHNAFNVTADNLSAHDNHKCTNATSCSYKLYSGMSLFTYALCMRIRINWEKTLSRLTIGYMSLITSLSIYLIISKIYN